MTGSGVRNGWGSTPSQSIGFVLGSALFLCWTLLVVISLSSIVFYSMKLRIILGCSWLLQFVLCYTLANFNILYLGFCKSSLPRMFPPLDMISEFRIQLDIIGPFVSHLYSRLGYSTGEFQALQLIVLAAFGVVDQPLASCMLVHLLVINSKL